jgi:hypothetical protein
MKNKTYFITLFIIGFLSISGRLYAKKISFLIDGFRITMPLSQIQERQRNEIVKYASLDNNKIQSDRSSENIIFGPINGDGELKFKGNKIKVRCKDVFVEANLTSHILNAVKGSVSGYKNKTINYSLDSSIVSLESSSLRITPQSAEIAASVKIYRYYFKPNPALVFTCNNAMLFNDGSIMGTNFTGNGTFQIGSFPGKLKIVPETNQKIVLGALAKTDQFEHGITFDGSASLGLQGFSYSAVIRDSSRWDEIRYKLNGLLTTEPECGYLLKLKKGNIEQIFKPVFGPKIRGNVIMLNPSPYELRRLQTGWKESVCGNILLDITVPDKCPAPDGSKISVKDVKLNVDSSWHLAGKLVFPSIMITPTVTATVIDSSAWCHFNNWYISTSKVYSNSLCDGKPDCNKHIFDYFKRVSVLERQGVTLLHGALNIELPQSDQSEPLHTKFFGSVTLVPSGAAGTFDSGGYSIVPSAMSDSIIGNRITYNNLATIIAFGNEKPKEPVPIFKLANLNILRMTIDSLKLCHGEVYESCFSYDVHFPYPSHIGVDFVDTTYGSDGTFKHATGPDCSKKISIQEIFTDIPVKPENGPAYNSEGKILWFWRLPIQLYRKGVSVDYQSISNPNEPYGNSYQQSLGNERVKISINKADLSVMPVYAKDEDRTGGVPIEGRFSAKGFFQLNDFDNDNTFGKYNSKSFSCLLGKIKLVDIDQLPANRQLDLEWHGDIILPFFGKTPVSFIVRNLVPIQARSIIADYANKNNNGQQDSLRVKTQKIKYDYNGNAFYTKDFSDTVFHRLRVWDKSGKSGSLFIQSYTSAVWRPEIFGRENILIDSCALDDCGRSRAVIQKLIGVNSGEIDLICYDAQAYQNRLEKYPELAGVGCGEEKTGTYVVLTKLGNEAPADTVWKVPEAHYIRNHEEPNGLIRTDYSETILSSDEPNDIKKFEIVIKDAKLIAQIGQGTVTGSFKGNTSIGEIEKQITIESNTQFSLNAKCGFLFYRGDGTINDGYPLRGSTLIVHDQVKSIYDGESAENIELSHMLSSVLSDPGTFRNENLSDPEDKAVLTGILSEGKFNQIEWEIVNLQINALYYYLKVKRHGFDAIAYSGKRGGVEGHMDFGEIEGAVKINLYGELDETNPAETLCGNIKFIGCVGVLLAHVNFIYNAECCLSKNGILTTMDGDWTLDANGAVCATEDDI